MIPTSSPGEEALDARDVTFVIPTRDRPEMLQRAISSVVAIGHPVIVVDDGSTPKVEFARPTVTVVRHPTPRGVSAARNTGILATRTAWVAFLDDDDVTLPRPLPRGVVSVYGMARRVASDTVLDSYTPHVGQTAVLRASCPLFDETYPACEDIEWWLRLIALGPVDQFADPGFRWTQHDALRVEHGSAARLVASRRLLADHADYFASHRRARAFRLARISALHRAVGEHSLAFVSAARSFAAYPSLRPWA